MAANKTHFRTIDYTGSSPERVLVILGTAIDGPSNVPFRVVEDASVYDILGSTPLANAYVQAYKAGARDILLYRINGEHATSTLSYRNEDGSFTPVLSFRSVSGGDQYNSVSSKGTMNHSKVTIDGVSLTVKRTDGTFRVYLLQEYQSAAVLAERLNIDCEYGLIEFETTALVPDFKMSLFTDEAAFTALFTGGKTEEDLIVDRKETPDPLILAELKHRIAVALFGIEEEDQLEREPNTILGLIDYGGITIADFFYEDDPEIAIMLGDFCQKKVGYSGHGCISGIGTRPLYSPTAESILMKGQNLLNIAPVAQFTNHSGPGNAAEEILVGDLTVQPLNYVQIITGDTLAVTKLGTLAEPISLVYAYMGSLVSSSYYINPTNKTISGIKTLNYEFSKEVIDNLTANGYISIVSSIRRGFVPYFAITGVGRSSKSSFKKPHYIRISQHIGRILYENLDDIVGTVRGKTTASKVEAKISELMQILVDSGVIRGYGLVCKFTNYNTLLTVNVSFTPYSDIETVSSTTTLPLGQGVIGQ